MTKSEKVQLFTLITSLRVEQFCRKCRRAADINYYVQRWARGLTAHIVLYLSDLTENKRREKEEVI